MHEKNVDCIHVPIKVSHCLLLKLVVAISCINLDAPKSQSFIFPLVSHKILLPIEKLEDSKQLKF